MRLVRSPRRAKSAARLLTDTDAIQDSFQVHASYFEGIDVFLVKMTVR